MTFGNWLWPSRRRQLFSAASASLKIKASAVLFDRHPLERTVRWREQELSILLLCNCCSTYSSARLSFSLRRWRNCFCRQALEQVVASVRVGMKELPQHTQMKGCMCSAVGNKLSEVYLLAFVLFDDIS